MNEVLLSAKIESSKLSKTFLAESLGLTRQGFYNKLNGTSEFKGSEIKRLSAVLGLSDAEKDEIFFADYVDRNSTRKDDLT